MTFVEESILSQKHAQQVKLAVLYHIVKALEDVGKIQLQKTVYFLQEAFEVPTKYAFRMHHYGPYSDDLDTDLTRLKMTGYLEIRPDPAGFGFHVGILDEPEVVWVSLVDPYTEHIEQVVALVRDRPSYELELMATLHFVDQLFDSPSEEELVSTVHGLKPKFTVDYILRFQKELIDSGLLKN